MAPAGASSETDSAQSTARVLTDANVGDRRAARRARVSIGHLGRTRDGPASTRAVQCVDGSDLERTRFASPMDRPAPTDAAGAAFRAATRDRPDTAVPQSL